MATPTRSYVIAVLPGDGIGLEVTEPALTCLDAAAQRFGFQLEYRRFPWASCTYYLEHGKMMPDNWKELLQACDAIFFGAVGDPASPYLFLIRGMDLTVMSSGLGVAVLIANWTRSDRADQSFAQAARSQLAYLTSLAPRTSDGAISHRASQVQLW